MDMMFVRGGSLLGKQQTADDNSEGVLFIYYTGVLFVQLCNCCCVLSAAYHIKKRRLQYYNHWVYQVQVHTVNLRHLSNNWTLGLSWKLGRVFYGGGVRRPLGETSFRGFAVASCDTSGQVSIPLCLFLPIKEGCGWNTLLWMTLGLRTVHSETEKGVTETYEVGDKGTWKEKNLVLSTILFFI